MTGRRGRGEDQGPGLFDLPLHTDPDDEPQAPAPEPPAPASEDTDLDEALAGESLFDDPLTDETSPEETPPAPLAEPVEPVRPVEPARPEEPAPPSALSLFPELDEELEREPEPEDEPEVLAEPVRTEPPAPLSTGPRAVPDLPFEESEEEDEVEAEAEVDGDGDVETGEPRPAALGPRLSAGLTDLAVMVGVGLILWLGSRALGVETTSDHAPALALFLLLFSAVYTIIPLAFWGKTPGMTRAGLIARTADGEPLTFGQTARRWAGGILTALLLGLPMLLALGDGGSLSDRLSASETFETYA